MWLLLSSAGCPMKRKSDKKAYHSSKPAKPVKFDDDGGDKRYS